MAEKTVERLGRDLARRHAGVGQLEAVAPPAVMGRALAAFIHFWIGSNRLHERVEGELLRQPERRPRLE